MPARGDQGHRRRLHLRPEGKPLPALGALAAAMTRSGVRRLVCITGIGAGDSHGHGGFLHDRLLFPLFLRNVYKDKDRQEDAIRASSLN